MTLMTILLPAGTITLKSRAALLQISKWPGGKDHTLLTMVYGHLALVKIELCETHENESATMAALFAVPSNTLVTR
jgi:hypothetical protein